MIKREEETEREAEGDRERGRGRQTERESQRFVKKIIVRVYHFILYQLTSYHRASSILLN